MSKFKAPTKPDVVEEPTTFPDAVMTEHRSVETGEKVPFIWQTPSTEPKHSFCGICNATVAGRIDFHLATEHT